MDAALETLLVAHVERFNEAVRSGDYAPMLEAFAPDAEMVFEGVPAGPFVGREAIAAAYAAQPPTDEVLLLGADSGGGGRRPWPTTRGPPTVSARAA